MPVSRARDTAMTSTDESAHGLAETTDGTVWAWGDNSAGQLGDGITLVPLDPEAVPGVTARR